MNEGSRDDERENDVDSDSEGETETNRTDEPVDGEVITYDERDTSPSGLPDRVGSEAETTLPAPDDESRELETDADPDETEANDDRAGPLGELAAGLDERGERSSAFDDLFERESVDEIDGDALWEQIEREEFDDAILADREIREIPKRTYCHRCEHFSAPPEVACENDGTDVLELTSLDSFRVADCPVVLEDEELEEGTRT